MIFKGILPEAIAGGVVKAVTPQEGGSTEMSGALGRLIAQNPEILEVLKKGSPQTPGVEESKPPAYEEFLKYYADQPDDMFKAAPAVVTPIEYEGVTYNFGNPLQAEAYLNFMENRRQEQIVNQPLPETPTSFPISPPTPVVENPFQRPTEAPPVARALPMPEPNRVAAGPALTQMEMSSPFFRGQQPNVALTPAEVLAMARNPFNRPS